MEESPSEELIDANPFRGGLALARSMRDAWPWFVFTGCFVFLADVFVRRVSVNFDWVGRLAKRLSGADKEKDATVTARLDALRKHKEELDDSMEKRRASVRFEPTSVDADVDEIDLTNMTSGKPEQSLPSGDSPKPEPEARSYTERLLEAKRKANKNK